MNLALIVFIYPETLISFSNLSGFQIKNSLITLLTDFGPNSFQTVRSRAWLTRHCAQQNIFDVSHDIHPNDINEAAYVFTLVQDQFQDKTVHIIAIDFDKRIAHQEIILFEYNNQFILTYNSGLATILLGEDSNDIKVVGTYDGQHIESVVDCFGPLAKQLVDGQLSDQKPMLPDQLHIKTPLHPVTTEKMLHGHVVYFDSRETCYTNISKQVFDQFVSGGSFDIILSRHERISKITSELRSYEGGGTYCYFNTSGMLTISVYRGSAKRMYGLKRGQTIMIEKR